jgi:hypothetical protein
VQKGRRATGAATSLTAASVVVTCLEPLGDLLDILGVDARGIKGRDRVQVWHLAALGWAVPTSRSLPSMAEMLFQISPICL